MASSRQNSSQMLNSQSSSSNSTTSTNAKDKTVHAKSDAKNKHDKSSSSSSGHVPMSSNTIINSMNNMSKRKGTSFQITSVSVSSGNTQQQQQQQQQRTSADNNNGDDSADDLDESHTDDNISRITDYETPSFSEDTFSREDVFFAQPNAFGTAPVIPTSSQYGLAIVGPDLGGNGGSNLSDVHVSVTDAGINIMGHQIPNKQDVDHKNERFKVVKIESTEPFKRGRWMCMDYLDHTTLQAQDDGIDGSPKEDADDNAGKTKDSGLESGLEGSDAVMMDNGEMDHMNDNDGYDQEVMKAEMNHHGEPSHEHHTMTSIPIHNEHSPMVVPIHAQSMPQGHLQKIISQDSYSESKHEHLPSDTLPTQASQNQNFGGSHQHPSQDNNSPMTHHHAHSMTPDMIQRSLQQENHQQSHHHNQHHHQLQQQQPHQGVTLPTNILMQNLGLLHHQQSQKQNFNNNASNLAASPLPSHNALSADNMGENEIKQQHHHHDSVTSQFQNQQVGIGDNNNQQHQQQISNESDQQQSANASTNDNIISNSVSDNNNMNSNDGTQNIPSPSSSAGLGTATAEGGASELNSNNANSANNAAATGGDDGQSINEDSERRFPPKTNVRTRKASRTCYLPHQLVHQQSNRGILKQMGIFTGNLFSGTSSLLRETASQDIFTNLLKRNFLDTVKTNAPVDQIPLANKSTHNQNLMLSDQSSRSTPVGAVASRGVVDSSTAGLTAAAFNINFSSLGPLYAIARAKDPNSSNRVSRAASPALGTADNNSASGTSAVAIDNKIEQAMDLVKSHLMFAVREEVEVLKEKINELMDRINQLEVENTILKANASQETLSQLTTAATIVVSPQAQVQTSPAQPQSLPALSKINIDASILQVSNITGSAPSQPLPSSNPQPQNPATTS